MQVYLRGRGPILSGFARLKARTCNPPNTRETRGGRAMALACCRPRNPLANVRRRFRPELLALEDRLVPAQLTWQGDIAGNSNWNAGVIGTNTNWSGNVIPQDGD